MAHITHLSALINALSKSEKRYFRLNTPWQAGEKIYGALYEMLEKGNSSGKEIKQKLALQFPEAVLEPACKHLYKMLMRSLRNYEAEKSVENKLLNLLGDVKILFNKGLFERCFSEIEKANELALSHEKFGLYLQFARLELQYLTNLEFPNITESDLLQKQEKINDLLYHELFINRHGSLFELLSYRYLKQGQVRDEAETVKLNDLLLEEFQVNATRKYSSFESDKLHLHFQSTYFLMTGNPEQSLQIFKELNLLFQEKKAIWADAPVYYIYLLNGILTDLQLTKRFGDMPYFLEELKQVQTHADSLHNLQQHLVYFHKIGIASGYGQFDESQHIILHYEETMFAKKSVIPPNSLAAMHFRQAVVYFVLEDYSKSLQLINNILNASSSFISPLLYALCRLLNLLVHLELQNEDYLHYEIKSVERKLKKGKKLFNLEKITLQFLKKWVGGLDNTKALQSYLKALSELEENNFESQLMFQFPFQSWVISRLQKVPLATVIQKQMQN